MVLRGESSDFLEAVAKEVQVSGRSRCLRDPC